jgi:hypothetical protein
MAISIILTTFLILVSFFVFAFGVFYLTARYKRIMLGFCLFFVAAGFSLYIAGYLSSGTGLPDALFSALRGIVSAARMFSMKDDYGALADTQGTQWLTENIGVQIFLWCCYVSAIIIVQTAIISLFGRKLIGRFLLYFGLHKEVYIIKGRDKNALQLAENIATHDAGGKILPDKKRLIVFLLEEDDDDEKIYKKISRFGGIVQVLDRKHDLSFYLKKARMGKEKKHTVILMPQNESPLDDAYLTAEFAKGKGICPENLDIFVFASSEWDRKKIEEITQAKEGGKCKYPCTFHIVNEVELLTRQMIEKHPPFECPALNFSGGVTSHNFTVMILGFGSVGQSALLRLVMNGQFVGSRMRAIIVDRDIEHLHGHFLHCYPSLNLCCDTEFMPFDVRDTDFYKLLDANHHLDYIVVSLNDDTLGRQTALDIRLHYERKDVETKPLIAVYERSGSLYQEKQDEKIFVFGSREEVYKESVIIREKTDRMAKAVNNTYKEIYGGQPWHELDWFLQESNRAAADFIPAMLKLAGRSEKEAIEKMALTDDGSFAEILAKTEHLRWNAFHAAMGYRPIDTEEMNKRFNEYNGNGNRLDFARRDSKARLQVCLVHWDELDKISEAYRDLEKRAGKEPKRDFKENDRDVIRNIPKFLKKTEENDHAK